MQGLGFGGRLRLSFITLAGYRYGGGWGVVCGLVMVVCLCGAYKNSYHPAKITGDILAQGVGGISRKSKRKQAHEQA